MLFIIEYCYTSGSRMILMILLQIYSSQGVPVMARVLSTQLPTIWGRLTCFSSVIGCISISSAWVNDDGCQPLLTYTSSRWMLTYTSHTTSHLKVYPSNWSQPQPQPQTITGYTKRQMELWRQEENLPEVQRWPARGPTDLFRAGDRCTEGSWC